jgi:hypothetical protein
MNKKHIVSHHNVPVILNSKKHLQLRAGYHLDTLLGGDRSVYHMRVTCRELPFVSLDKGEEWSSVLPHGRRACCGQPCPFETTASHSQGTSSTHTAMRRIGWTWRSKICESSETTSCIMSFAPSLVVDGKLETAFRGLLSIFFPYLGSCFNCRTDAAQGDTMTLDMPRDVSKLYSDIQVTLLVDNATEHILRACTFETSPDGWLVTSGLTAGFRVP